MDGTLTRSKCKVVVVGQAPSRTSGPLSFDGPSGDRLASLLELRGAASLREIVDLANLIPEWPGRRSGGRGDAFPLDLARDAALDLLPSLDGRAVVLCGRGVAAAFGLGLLPYLEWVTRRLPDSDHEACVFPHPSRVSHWWNQKRNQEAARAFLSRCVAAG